MLAVQGICMLVINCSLLAWQLQKLSSLYLAQITLVALMNTEGSLPRFPCGLKSSPLIGSLASLRTLQKSKMIVIVGECVIQCCHCVVLIYAELRRGGRHPADTWRYGTVHCTSHCCHTRQDSQPTLSQQVSASSLIVARAIEWNEVTNANLLLFKCMVVSCSTCVS